MPVRSLKQSSFFDPEFACPDCLEPGTVPWLLARFRSRLFPTWLFMGWRGGRRLGRNAWPAVVLMTLVLLRWTEEGMSRCASVRRARKDVEWRAALGIALDDDVPSERTVRDFEKFLRKRHPKAGQPRYLLFHEHVVRMCIDGGVVSGEAVWATDSTPMWCYGAVLDTVRLLGDGLRALGRRWARATRRTLEEVATDWGAPWLTGKSTKGALNIDWRDAEARADGLNHLADDVLRVVSKVLRQLPEARSGLRKSVSKACRRLLQVVRDDLESDSEGRLVIARHVAKDRLVSLTDPQARHGRKSKSQTFKGFKLHVVGDVVSGLIASLAVTPGNYHDNRPAHRLIRRASRLLDGIKRVLGDTAYGAASFRRGVRQTLGVEILAPPPPTPTRKNERFRKDDFEVDFVGGCAMCPNGVATDKFTTVEANGGASRRYAWPRLECDRCPMTDKCLPSGRRIRTLLLHPDEEELRTARQQWERPEVRAEYRTRSQCERLINQMTRHGGRKARAWGLGFAQLQAHAIAAVSNLGLLAKIIAESG
jgi:hypothetical protein